MVSVFDALGNSKPPLGASLAEGVKTLSADQELTFSLYRRYVFPLDGMNYWIRVPGDGTVTTAGIQPGPGMATQTKVEKETIQIAPGGIGAANIVGGLVYNPLDAVDQGLAVAEELFVDFTGPAYSHETATTVKLEPGESIDIPANCSNGVWVCSPSSHHKFTCILQKSISSVTLPVDVQVKGSFHYDSTIEQREDATVDSNNCIFTSLSEIQPFNLLGPDYLYICHYRDLTFAFSSRGRLYEQADLYHYLGRALFSVNATQIVDDYAQFDPKLVISNSLPIWLNMPRYVPPYPGFTCPIALYPSYLVDDNLPPPFGSIHIEGTETISLGTYYGPRLQSAQLCKELVRVHLYGCNQRMADDFVSFVEQYSKDWMNLGLTDSPAVKDEKHTQPEMKILSQRKMIEFSINYVQITARDQARQFIEHAKVQFFPDWLQGN